MGGHFYFYKFVKPKPLPTELRYGDSAALLAAIVGIKALRAAIPTSAHATAFQTFDSMNIRNSHSE